MNPLEKHLVNLSSAYFRLPSNRIIPSQQAEYKGIMRARKVAQYYYITSATLNLQHYMRLEVR